MNGDNRLGFAVPTGCLLPFGCLVEASLTLGRLISLLICDCVLLDDVAAGFSPITDIKYIYMCVCVCVCAYRYHIKRNYFL